MRGILLLFLVIILCPAEKNLDAARTTGKIKRKQSYRGRISCINPKGAEHCMVCNCFNEAGNQSYAGQVDVGEVVMSRVGLKHYPDSVCGVIKQKKQFSWYNRYSSRSSVPGRHSCVSAARKSLRFRGCKADHYHANYVAPRWRRRMTRVYKRGAHIFYSKFCRRANKQKMARLQSRAAGSRFMGRLKADNRFDRRPASERRNFNGRQRPQQMVVASNRPEGGFFRFLKTFFRAGRSAA